MRETPLSTVEKTFVLQSIKQNQRLDGRKNDEFRTMKINFGADWGSVMVSLGESKVLAQVSCELGLPKATRPNEGMMYINVELGPMAASHFEASRNSDLNVQINRTLERTFKDSRCVDLESLCVTAEDRVWILRVDLNVLNHEGNLIDCCSIATLAALAHFKRPDVTIDKDEVKIHTAAEKEPIPMVMHHYPVCVTFCTYDDGQIAITDPTAVEERCAESQMIFGLNSFRELCCLNLGGITLTSTELLLRCAKTAAKQAKFVVDRVKELLEIDAATREAGQSVSFTECMRLNKINAMAEDRLSLKLRHFSFSNIHDRLQQRFTIKEEDDSVQMMEAEGEDGAATAKHKVISLDAQTGVLNSQKSTIKWVPDDDDDDDDDEDDENVVNMDSDKSTADDEDGDENLAQQVESAMHKANARSNQPISKQKRKEPLPFSQRNMQQPAADSDSEEEVQMVL